MKPCCIKTCACMDMDCTNTHPNGSSPIENITTFLLTDKEPCKYGIGCKNPICAKTNFHASGWSSINACHFAYTYYSKISNDMRKNNDIDKADLKYCEAEYWQEIGLLQEQGVDVI